MTAGGISSQSEGAETQLDHFPLSLAAVFLSPFPLGPQPSSLRAKIPIYQSSGRHNVEILKKNTEGTRVVALKVRKTNGTFAF